MPEIARLAGPPAGLANRTRTSPSIPRRLLREGRPWLLPLYALLRTSDLGREGIEGSGSWRFADHVYRARPSGRHGVGRLLDGLLLRTRAARSMRSRFLHTRAEIVAAGRGRLPGSALRVLSVPCGIAREMVEAATRLYAEDPALRGRASFTGIDLDPLPLAASRSLAAGLPGFSFLRGDAFDPAVYPRDRDVIVSTGLAEFLSDDEVVRFYAICRESLAPEGVLVTSATRRDRFSDWLMRELAELRARYRDPDEIVRLLRGAGFPHVSARSDGVGLQTLIVARIACGGSPKPIERKGTSCSTSRT